MFYKKGYYDTIDSIVYIPDTIDSIVYIPFNQPFEQNKMEWRKLSFNKENSEYY